MNKDGIVRPATEIGTPFLLVLLFALSGCVSAPRPLPPADAVSWLGGKPQVLVRLDATKVKAWREITRGPDLNAVGERTRVVWLGLDLESLDDLKSAAQSLHVVLEGDFPKGAAGLMLDWNTSWKKNGQVWTNAKYNLSVSLPRDNIVTVRRDDAAVVPAADALRDLDTNQVSQAAMWVSLWNPGQMLFGPVGAKLLPIERLDVVLHEQGLYLQGPVVMYFSDERAAKAASVVLKLVANALRARLGQDLTWTVDGTQIVGQELRIKQEDLKTLAQSLVAPGTP